MSEKIFNIGDVVWVALCGRRPFEEPCAVCFGQKRVVVILGNGDAVETPCSHCGLGYDGPRGFVTEYRIEPAAEQRTITGREIREGKTTEVNYHSAGGYIHYSDRVFLTEAEALAESVKLCEKEINDRETRSAYIKGDKIKSFAWNVGYHLREAKKLREKIDYHERMAVACKLKVKP